MLPSKGAYVHPGFWEDQHKALQREVQCSGCCSKRWVGSSNMSAQKKVGERQLSNFWGIVNSGGGWNTEAAGGEKKKKVSETFTKGFGFFLFRECGFRRTNKRHHWHYMVDELSVRRTEDCGRQTTAHFHDVLRKEQEELSWEQVTPISSSSVNF